MKTNYYVIVYKKGAKLMAKVFTTIRARNEYLKENFYNSNIPDYNKKVGIPYDITGKELTNKIVNNNWSLVGFY